MKRSVRGSSARATFDSEIARATRRESRVARASSPTSFFFSTTTAMETTAHDEGSEKTSRLATHAFVRVSHAHTTPSSSPLSNRPSSSLTANAVTRPECPPKNATGTTGSPGSASPEGGGFPAHDAPVVASRPPRGGRRAIRRYRPRLHERDGPVAWRHRRPRPRRYQQRADGPVVGNGRFLSAVLSSTVQRKSATRKTNLRATVEIVVALRHARRAFVASLGARGMSEHKKLARMAIRAFYRHSSSKERLARTGNAKYDNSRIAEVLVDARRAARGSRRMISRTRCCCPRNKCGKPCCTWRNNVW